jgi:hypothetical protein
MLMREELLKYRGMLAETERKIAELDVIIAADVSNARSLLNPFQEDHTRLDTAKVVAVANRIHENVELLRKAMEKAVELREAIA